jgi:hypothetical protein
MATDPKKTLPPSEISSLAKTDIDRLLQTGLADFSLRELLGLLVSSAGAAERNVYLQDTPADKSNGFYDRSLQLGSIPIDIGFPAPAMATSAQPAFRHRIAAATAKKCSPYWWGFWDPAGRSMRPKMPFRRWAFPVPNRIWNASPSA